MPPIQHALLSASSAYRWLKCPPSVMATKDIRDEPSVYAEEGSTAHEMAEYKVRRYLGEADIEPPPTGRFDAAEIDRHTDTYLYYVTEKIEAIKKSCPDAAVLVEQRLDFSNYVKDGFGTGDLVIVADNVIQVIDFKYGKGVAVSAERNPHMMLYALGALNLYDYLYDIKAVKMAIVQPRLNSISEWEIPVSNLLEWAENTLKPIAALAAKGEGEFRAGEHCRFCRIKATCRKRAEYNLELARYDFEMPAALNDNEIEIILSKVDELTAWCSDVKEYALQKALSGAKFTGFKVVEGRSSRKYSDEDAVADVVKKAGYDPFEHKVMGITAMTKLLGRAKFEELLGGFIVKSKGRPMLVPMSDKRPAITKAAEAAEDFKEDN